MMESARQELQGQREYMSNGERWNELGVQRSNGIQAAAHSLIIRGFTLVHYEYSATLEWIIDTTKRDELLTNVSHGYLGRKRIYKDAFTTR